MHLDADKPYLSVRASTTKNGKPATIWMGADLVAELRLLSVNAAAGSVVFTDGVPSMERFRADLALARIKEADGRKLVFHSLRHTLATQLVRSSVPPRVAMEVMRHSDLRLTMKAYTDSSLLPTSEVLDKLPVYGVGSGVDDAQKDTQKFFPEGPEVSKCARFLVGVESQKVSKTSGKTVDLAGSVPVCSDGAENWGTRIRT